MADLSADHRFRALKASGVFDGQVVDRLADFIRTADEEHLFRASPLRVSSRLGINENEAIDLFLHSVHAGILDFSWGVLCPMCASFLTTPGGLRSLRVGRRCHFCQIDIRSQLEDNVEVAFTVAPSVRPIRFHRPEELDMKVDGFKIFFSSSLPGSGMFHARLIQALIEAGRVPAMQTREVDVELTAGRYVIMAPDSHNVLHFSAAAGAPAPVPALDLMDGAWIPDQIRIPAGKVRLAIRNRTKRNAGFLILPDPIPPPEDRPGSQTGSILDLRPFLTGKRLICTQAFRDLFRAESIPSEGGLELKNLTVLFTDLKESTQLYERVGDLNAYDLVRRHFSILNRISVRQGGSVVKTIGDAIMAVFPEPETGLQAAIDMNREIAQAAGADLRLKIGLHCGACIAVELNERLDYFGRTVNIASRVQNLADAREIICTGQVYDSSGAGRIIRESGLTVRPDQVPLKGIAGDTRIFRLK